MTTQTSNARRYSPIFTATVTPASVSTKTAANGNKYLISKGSTLQKGDAEPKTVTLMAFGKSRDEVAGVIRKGRPVDLAVQYDGGSLKVIGLPRDQAAAA